MTELIADGLTEASERLAVESQALLHTVAGEQVRLRLNQIMQQ